MQRRFLCKFLQSSSFMVRLTMHEIRFFKLFNKWNLNNFSKTCGWFCNLNRGWCIPSINILQICYLKAWNYRQATKAMASVAPGLCLGAPFKSNPWTSKIFQWKCSFLNENRLVLSNMFKDEILGAVFKSISVEHSFINWQSLFKDKFLRSLNKDLMISLIV